MAPSVNPNQPAGGEEKKFRYDFSAKGGFPQPLTFEDKREEREYLKGRLTAAFRIFAKYGLNEGVAGHITLRDPVEPDTFWVNPLGVSFALIKRSDLVRLDDEGKVIDHGDCKLVNQSAFLIHAAVHRARPDVICAAHAHSFYGRTFSGLGLPLAFISQDACTFYNDIALYDQFDGIVLGGREGDVIAAAMGGSKAVILRNHGLLTAGASIEAAVFWFVALESLCHSQLVAMAACAHPGVTLKEVGHAEAQETYDTLGQHATAWFSAKPMFDLIAHETGEDYLQ
ncbi:class II aldolase adducin domain [Cordyceps militaris]|uniref:Class II aldolase adducin domain n=1 Tax=Cordyceps militaris TaxID=73501 RepID=A0A2H4SCL6_CORMI|nr:class II aldolase adducin domain [Cordyceps militaris]